MTTLSRGCLDNPFRALANRSTDERQTAPRPDGLTWQTAVSEGDYAYCWSDLLSATSFPLHRPDRRTWQTAPKPYAETTTQGGNGPTARGTDVAEDGGYREGARG